MSDEKTIFDLPNTMVGEVTGALITATHDVPCWHKKKRRKRDAKKGRPHGATHPRTELVAYTGGPFTVFDQEIVPNGGDITINWNKKGVMEL